QHALVTAGDVLTLDELRSLRRVSGVRGAALVLHAWGTIGLAMAGAALWPSVFTLMLAFVVVGSRQLGLFVLMHETAHWLLLPGLRSNSRVGAWLCANPVWAEDLTTYRQ